MYSFPTETTKPPSMRPNRNFGVPPELVQDREVCAILAHSDACHACTWLRVLPEAVDPTDRGLPQNSVCVTRVRYTTQWLTQKETNGNHITL